MFRKLKDIPDGLGNIEGLDYEADINVRVSQDEKIRSVLTEIAGLDKELSFDKIYHINKITCYGDPFDVWVINDLGELDSYGEWIFEDIIDEEVTE